MIISKPHPRTGLLELPLELRQEIYCLLLPLQQNPFYHLTRYSCCISDNFNGYFRYILNNSCRGERSWVICEYTNRQPRVPIGLLALRTTRSQLYHEITSLTAVNWIPKKLENTDRLTLQRVGIADTAAFKLCSQPWVSAIMRQARFRQEVGAVHIHLSPAALYSWFANSWRRLINEPAGKLRNLAAVLAIYSQLQTIIITASGTAVFSTWSDLLGDAESFAPLVERGVRVTFWVDCTYTTESNFKSGIKGSWKERESKEMEWRRAFDEIIKRKKATDVASAKGRLGSGIAGKNVEWTTMPNLSQEGRYHPQYPQWKAVHYHFLPMWELSLVDSEI